MDLKFDLKNPYPHTAQGIASEILQLLLVVERIKADKDSYQRLRSLAKVRQAFEDSPQVRSLKNAAPFHTRTDSLPQSTLCSVLDEGLGASSFSCKSIRFADYKGGRRQKQNPTTVNEAPEQHHWCKVWTEDIPAIIDSQHYHFENLNRLRLHYPHLQILLAYVYGKELLLVATKLIELDYSKFVITAKEWANQEFGHICSDTYLDSSHLSLMIAHRVSDRATELFLNELNGIIQRAKRYLDWSFEEGYYFPRPKVAQQEKVMSDWQGRSLGEQPVLTIELLQADVKRAIEEGDLDLISADIARSLANKINPEKYGQKFIQSNTYQQSIIELYEQYSTAHTLLLRHANNELQFNDKTLIRGIFFSIWREKYQEKVGKKLAVLKATKLFLKEEDKLPNFIGKPNTIKQSYEEMKGYAKSTEDELKPSPLVKLIRSQMTARLPFYSPKVRYVFAPFNINYEEKVREMASSFGNLLDFDVNQCSYKDICNLFRSLSSKELSTSDRDDLVEVLKVNGINIPSKRLNYRLDRHQLAEVLRSDIWVGD